MTIQENARFTVYRLVSEYNPQDGNLWDIAKAIQTAYNINAISLAELKMLGYNTSRLSVEEILTA